MNLTSDPADLKSVKERASWLKVQVRLNRLNIFRQVFENEIAFVLNFSKKTQNLCFALDKKCKIDDRYFRQTVSSNWLYESGNTI